MNEFGPFRCSMFCSEHIKCMDYELFELITTRKVITSEDDYICLVATIQENGSSRKVLFMGLGHRSMTK